MADGLKQYIARTNNECHKIDRKKWDLLKSTK